MSADPTSDQPQSIRKVVVATTMGPGVPIDPNVVKNLREVADA